MPYETALTPVAIWGCVSHHGADNAQFLLLGNALLKKYTAPKHYAKLQGGDHLTSVVPGRLH
jgi:hypothetical protein